MNAFHVFDSYYLFGVSRATTSQEFGFPTTFCQKNVSRDATVLRAKTKNLNPVVLHHLIVLSVVLKAAVREVLNHLLPDSNEILIVITL